MIQKKILLIGNQWVRNHWQRYGKIQRMMYIMNYSKGDIVLFPYPFTDLETKKVRPAIVISDSGDKFI